MSIRIARFVDLAACRSIFSDNSTFVLRSEKFYQKQYETDRGDEQELIQESPRRSRSFENVLLSCWTILDGKEPTEAEWGLFEDSVVAIISTPAKVCEFLKNAFELGDAEQPESRRFPVLLLDHKAVRYGEVEPETTAAKYFDEVVFYKRAKFGDQKEYRFALPFSAGLPHHIETYIFSRDPFEYLETCYANPAMCEEQRHDLRQILLNAFGGDGHFRDGGNIFANLDFVLH